VDKLEKSKGSGDRKPFSNTLILFMDQGKGPYDWSSAGLYSELLF